MENLILTDYIFLFITAISTLFGFARGFLREVFTVLNMVLAIAASYLLYPTAVKFLTSHLKDELWIKGSAAIGSFVLCWVIVAIINSFVLDALKFMRGGFIDRIMGVALGLIRGALIVVGIYLGVVVTVNAQDDPSKLPAWMREAKSLNYIKIQSEYVVALMPKDFQDFYKTQDSNITEALSESVSDGIDMNNLPKLESMGFDAKSLGDLEKLLSGVDDSLKIEDLEDFSPSTIKLIGDQAIGDYKIDSGSVGELTIDQLEAIKKQLNTIKVKEAN